MKKIKTTSFIINLLVFVFLATAVVFLCISQLNFEKLNLIDFALYLFGIVSILSFIAFLVMSTIVYFKNNKIGLRYLNCFFSFLCAITLLISGILGLFESAVFEDILLSIYSGVIVLVSYTCLGFIFIYCILALYLSIDAPKNKLKQKNKSYFDFKK